MPRFTSLNLSWECARKAKTSVTKKKFCITPMLCTLIDSRGQTFFPIPTKLALIKVR